jgi:hypothetical protein
MSIDEVPWNVVEVVLAYHDPAVGTVFPHGYSPEDHQKLAGGNPYLHLFKRIGPEKTTCPTMVGCIYVIRASAAAKDIAILVMASYLILGHAFLLAVVACVLRACYQDRGSLAFETPTGTGSEKFGKNISFCRSQFLGITVCVLVDLRMSPRIALCRPLESVLAIFHSAFQLRLPDNSDGSFRKTSVGTYTLDS